MKLVLKVDFILDPVSDFEGRKIGDDLYFVIKEFVESLFDKASSIVRNNDGEVLGEFSTSEELASLCQTFNFGFLHIEPSQRGYGISSLRVTYLKNALCIKIVLGDTHIKQDIEPTVVEKALTCLMKIYDQFNELYYLSDDSGITIEDLAYPHVFPFKSLLDWGEANAVDIFQAAVSWEDSEALDSEEIVLLKSIESLPKIARVEIIKKFLMVKWIKDFSDEEVISNCLNARENWYVDNFPLPPEDGYNEFGDRLEQSTGFDEHPLLTFYDPREKIGYVSTHDTNQKQLIEDQLTEYTKWLQRGSLPDGTKINKLRLIVPDREIAINMTEYATSLGFDQILYFDEDLYLWNPNNNWACLIPNTKLQSKA